ncbi:Glutamate decarboxylase [Nymphon striatum]|nr:Glutamate decarboxylase [Nymphon striatum]
MASVLQTTRGKQQVTICGNTCALEEHIKRVRLQSRVWCQATVMQQQPFEPSAGIWILYRHRWAETSGLQRYYPQAIIELITPKIKGRMMSKGTLMVGYQPLDDIPNFFRAIISSAAVSEDDIDFLLDETERLGKDL